MQVPHRHLGDRGDDRVRAFGALRLRRRPRMRRRGAGHRRRGPAAHRRRLTRPRRRRLARDGSAALRTAPPFVVQRLWLDRPVQARIGRRSSGRADARRWTMSACSNATNARRRKWSRRTGGSVVELHSYAVTGRAPRDLRDRMLARLHELYPETEGANVVDERVLCRNDCPRFAPGDHAARPTVATPHRRGAGRRRHPHRPARGPDGTRRHHGLVGGEPRCWPTTGWAGMRCTPCRSRAARRRCDGSRSGKGSASAMSKLDRPDVAAGENLAVPGASARAVGGQRPTYSDAEPAIIDAALRRSQRRPSGNWYAFAASDAIRDRPLGTSVGGPEIVAWRGDRRHAARRDRRPARTSAPTWRPARCDCGALVCPWHGLRLEGGREFGWKPYPAHDDGVLAWVRLDGARRRRRRPTRRCSRRARAASGCTPSRGWSARASRATSSPTGSTRGTAPGFTRTRSPGSRCSPHRRPTSTYPRRRTASWCR